jgi:heptosyltransferase II
MKILIIRLSSLGDVVLTQSVCAWLRQRYPTAEIDFITKVQYKELVSLMGCGLNFVPYEKTLRSHLALRAARYDLVLDLHNKLSSFLIRLAAMGRTSSVLDKKRAIREKIVRGNRKLSIRSTIDLYAGALTKLGLSMQLEAPVLQVPGLALPFALPTGKKLIMLFPGAAHFTKMYPVASYQALLRMSPDYCYYILAGSALESELCDELHNAAPEKSLNLCGKLSFGQILKAMQSCELVISSDSGPMHLAAALQMKQIAIFGATHPRLGFAPNNPHAHILCLDLACQPCSLHGADKCPLGHFKCMLGIEPQRILELILP